MTKISHAQPAARTTTRETLTIDAVAEALGISRNNAYAKVRTGEIPAIRIGRRWLVPRKRLEAWLNDEGTDRP